MNTKINSRYIIMTAIAVTLSWLFHESIHWITGTLLGNEMGMTLNTTFPVTGSYPDERQMIIVSATAPLFTVLQATMFFFIIRRYPNPLLYPFLYTPLYMRALAGVMNVINLNDEGRIGQYFGIGTYTLSALVYIYLLFLVLRTSKQNRLTPGFTAATLGLVIVFSSIIILADQFLKVRIL